MVTCYYIHQILKRAGFAVTGVQETPLCVWTTDGTGEKAVAYFNALSPDQIAVEVKAIDAADAAALDVCKLDAMVNTTLARALVTLMLEVAERANPTTANTMPDVPTCLKRLRELCGKAKSVTNG